MRPRTTLGYTLGIGLALLLCSFIMPAHARESVVYAEPPHGEVNAIVTVGMSQDMTEERLVSEEASGSTQDADVVITVVSGGDSPAVAEANMEVDSNTHETVVIDGGIYVDEAEDGEDIPVVRVVTPDEKKDVLVTRPKYDDSSEIPTVRVRHEEIPEVPLYFQNDYPDTPYGSYGTVKSHGCGITCVAMVFSYLFDEEIMPDELAEEFGHYNTEDGSYHSLFPDSAEVYGISVEKTNDWDTVIEALENGQVIIANPTEDIFTDGGHFIVLYGITDDGRILVHDPNEFNYSGYGAILTDGFANGFEQKYIKYTCMPYYIYPLK